MMYKGFELRKGYGQWFVFDGEGRMVIALTTKKKCIAWIDSIT